jgi:xanthosine utilization system XapX-like protein
MRRRDIGRILMAAGVFLGIIYTLMNLSSAAGSTRLGNLILFTGIVALASGLIIFGAAGGSGSKRR